MSIFTFLPQLAICLIFGPLAPIAAGLLVLVESVAIIFFVGKPLLLGAVQEDLFDAVLVGRGHQQLVMKGRSVTNTASGAKKLGKTVAGPLQRFSKAGLIRYLVSLPLNAIPVVGTAMFLLFNGPWRLSFLGALMCSDRLQERTQLARPLLSVQGLLEGGTRGVCPQAPRLVHGLWSHDVRLPCFGRTRS
jgi:hypothetical protein